MAKIKATRISKEDEIHHENLWIARRLTAAYNFLQTEAFGEFINPGRVSQSPRPEGAEEPAGEIVIQHTAYPDIHYAEELTVAEGDLVFFGWQGTGTHLGSLYDQKATGIRLNLHGGEIMRFADGKVIEHFDHFVKPRLESLALLEILDEGTMEGLGQQGLL